MTRQRHGWAAGVAALLLVSSACGRSEPTTEPVRNSDATITTTIQARFFGDPVVKGHEIDVDTDDGVVKLSGKVESEAARTKAATLAQQVEGVTRVENALEVEAPDRTADADADDRVVARGRDATRDAAEAADRNVAEPLGAGWITTKIQAKYFGDDAVKGRRIDVTTSPSGEVTLEGEVDSEAARQQAVALARGTEGVTNVVDELRVVPEASGQTARAGREAREEAGEAGGAANDAWTTVKIESKYFMDADVKGRNIDVTTENGVVTLRGQVEDAEERRQAIALARATDGVREVRDELRVQPAEPDTRAGTTERSSTAAARGRTAAAAVNDEWIETKIQSKYFLEEHLREGEVDVSSQKGVVTLQGEVPSEDARQTAEEIARETDGVSNIVNRLSIAGTANQER